MTTAIDSQGIYYRIPIACINDPSKYSVNKVLEKMQAEKVPDEKINSETITSTNLALSDEEKTESNKEVDPIFKFNVIR